MQCVCVCVCAPASMCVLVCVCLSMWACVRQREREKKMERARDKTRQIRVWLRKEYLWGEKKKHNKRWKRKLSVGAIKVSMKHSKSWLVSGSHNDQNIREAGGLNQRPCLQFHCPISLQNFLSSPHEVKVQTVEKIRNTRESKSQRKFDGILPRQDF